MSVSNNKYSEPLFFRFNSADHSNGYDPVHPSLCPSVCLSVFYVVL